jgi:hypothetical protein
VRFSIDELPGSLDFAPKIGIADRLLRQEVDAASEEALQLLGEVEVPVCVSSIGLPVGHFDEEVQIAGRLQPIRRSRTENIQALDAVAPAEVGKRGSMPVNKLGH